MSDPSSSTAAAAPSGTSSADDLLRSVAAEQAQHDAQAKFDELQGELAQCRKDNERLTSEKKELGESNFNIATLSVQLIVSIPARPPFLRFGSSRERKRTIERSGRRLAHGVCCTQCRIERSSNATGCESAACLTFQTS